MTVSAKVAKIQKKTVVQTEYGQPLLGLSSNDEDWRRFNQGRRTLRMDAIVRRADALRSFVLVLVQV